MPGKNSQETSMTDRQSLSAIQPPTTNQTSSRALPAEWPVWVGGHWGAGQDCAVCTDAISPSQAEVRALFRRDDSRTFHARCFVDWWQGVVAAGEAGAA
jgi:hypothetical protein